MVYEQIAEYTARKAELSDIEAMYNLLTPYMIDLNEHKYTNEMYLRKLKKLLNYYVLNKDTLVVEKSGVIVGVYTGEDNKIVHLCSTGDIFSMAILLKTLLCDIHKITESSYFKVYTEKQRMAYANIKTIKGKIVIDENGNGTIDTLTKIDIKYLYDKIKDSYVK